MSELDLVVEKQYHEKAAAERANRSLAGCEMAAGAAQSEPTARGLLARVIRKGEWEIMEIRCLLDALPQKLPREAESALVKLIQRSGLAL